MPRLLVVHHPPSPSLQAAQVGEVELEVRPALSAGAADLLAADGVPL